MRTTTIFLMLFGLLTAPGIFAAEGQTYSQKEILNQVEKTWPRSFRRPLRIRASRMLTLPAKRQAAPLLLGCAMGAARCT